MLLPFILYKNNEIIATAEHFENLEEFVEELKKLNSKLIDRREFVIMNKKAVIKKWYRR